MRRAKDELMPVGDATLPKHYVVSIAAQKLEAWANSPEEAIRDAVQRIPKTTISVVTGEKSYSDIIPIKRVRDVAPVGDAEGTHKVSYKLNGPTVFEVNSSQFIEWAKKNKKEVSNFATRLKALQEFTGDPRLKDWET
jgi:hypothetical protein